MRGLHTSSEFFEFIIIRIVEDSRTRCDDLLFVYYESIKRELKTRPIYECRYDERLKTKPEKSTHLGYTGLFWELEHLKIKTRLIDEMFPSVMGECVFQVIVDPSIFKLIRKDIRKLNS